jgi:hypothetical protein
MAFLQGIDALTTDMVSVNLDSARKGVSVVMIGTSRRANCKESVAN